MQILIILCVTSYNLHIYAGDHADCPIDDPNIPQQSPFYFLNPVPVKVKLNDRIDLSFFRNRLVVLNYRYRIEVPDDESTGMDMRLRIWSRWQDSDLSELKIPVLDQEGGYKLVIEYTISGGKEAQRFEKPFYVYRVSMLSNASGSDSNLKSSENRIKPATVKTAVVEEPDNRPAVETGKIGQSSKEPLPMTRTVEKITDRDTLLDLSGVRADVEKFGGIRPEEENQDIIAAKISIMDESRLNDGLFPGTKPEIDTIISPSEEKIETAGTDSKLLGGNTLFRLNDNTGNMDSVNKLRRSGLSLDAQDINGNTPLHYAILSGMEGYAATLIELGANANVKNNLGLTPLHLTILLNNEDLAEDMLKNGADINAQGNTGYTALHIATELNNPGLVTYLLSKGANPGIKTSQGLSSKTIAQIQKNEEIMRLLGNKAMPAGNIPNQNKPGSVSLISSEPGSYPEIQFNLPYDRELARKRQFNKIVQLVSVPFFIASGSYAVHLKSQANHYYSLSKVAESEELARVYYEKTSKYDRSAYISGGISLVSAFGIIRSTLKKRSISSKMYKTINQGYIISK